MISKKVAVAINDQINAELWSAYLYLSMSLDAAAKGLSGVANWFFVQWLEEQDHARILQNYLVDQDVNVELQPIADVPQTWPTALRMFEDALEHEKEVTRMINKLVQMAYTEHDPATLSRLQWFVDEQVEEEKSVREVIDTIATFNDCCPGCAAFASLEVDKILANRLYHRSSAL